MKNKKLLAFLIAMNLILSPILASCNNTSNPNNPDTDSQSGSIGEVVEKTKLLTHIFRGKELNLPEGYTLNSNVNPVYDAQSGNMTLFCSSDEDQTDEEGNYKYIRRNHVITLDKDSNVLSEQTFELNDAEGNPIYINNGALVGDTLYFLSSEYDMNTMTETFYVSKYALTDGTITKSNELSTLFDSAGDSGRGWFYINYMCVDNDGWIYLSAEQEILVLDGEFSKKFSAAASDWINSMSFSPKTGMVYISSYLENGYGIIPLNKETQSFGTALDLGDLNAYNIFFGDGYDLYYTNDDGVFGVNFPTEENAESAETDSTIQSDLLMSYTNSDIYENNFELLKIVDNQTFIALERDPSSYERTPMLYAKAGDIDLSTIKTIEIAYGGYGYLPQEILESAIEFNKASTDTRITFKDYSAYTMTEDGYTAVNDRLTTDIVNGLYEPDIVIGSLSDSHITEIRDRGLYTDLGTYMDADELVNRDNIFAGVLESFSDDSGKVWGMCSEMNFSFIIGNRNLVGDRNGWTTEELLDFAISLPSDVQLFEDISQLSAATYIFGDAGYSSFIDPENNTCSFDSPLFIKYLEYIKKLPAEINYDARPEDYYETRYLNYHNGKIALSREGFHGLEQYVVLDSVFNTPDYALLGSPVDSEYDYSVPINASNTMVITSFCDYPAEAWSFIRTIIHPEPDEMWGGYRYYSGVPVVKSIYDALAAEFYENFYEFEVYFNGGMSWGPGDPENPLTTEAMHEPGIVAHFTEEDAAFLKDFLDKNAGFSASTAIADEINSIVQEEISTYAAGARTAADCAAIIQSRVSIWLAEHE